MAERTIAGLQERVRAFFETRPRNAPEDSLRWSAVEVLNRSINRGWRTYIVGGFLRDLAMSSRAYWPRDFDVVVEGCSQSELRDTFFDIEAGQNRFGGLRLKQWAKAANRRRGPCKLDFDIWRLEDTWAVRQLRLPYTMGAFVRTPFLNIDSIAISISPGQGYLAVFEQGFFNALTVKCVEINQSDNPYPVLCGVRGMLMAASLKFVIGPQLASYIYRLANQVGVEDLYNAQIGHYSHAKCSKEQLSDWLEDIQRQLDAGHTHVRLRSERFAGAPIHEPLVSPRSKSAKSDSSHQTDITCNSAKPGARSSEKAARSYMALARSPAVSKSTRRDLRSQP